MSLKEVVDYWKSILAAIVLVVGITLSIIAWAGEQAAVIEAKQQLLHDRTYQNSRIVRKEDQKNEAEREIDSLEDDEGELTPRQVTKVEKLDTEVLRLEKEIEEIRVLLQQSE